jgi:hypothetical protein
VSVTVSRILDVSIVVMAVAVAVWAAVIARHVLRRRPWRGLRDRWAMRA